MAFVGAYGPFVLLFGVFYFMLYRPQKKEQKRRQELLASLKKGAKIMTVGGIYGEIVSIKDEVVRIKIADRVEIDVARSSIGVNLSNKDAEKSE